MGGGGGGGSKHTTQQINIDPQKQAWIEANRAYAKHHVVEPYQRYEGQRYADLTNLQHRGINQGVQAASQLPGTYQTAIGAASDIASGNGVEAPLVSGPNMATLPEVSSNRFSSQAAQRYMNPYTEAVIQPALQDINEQLSNRMQRIDASAEQANAFGGTRMAVRNAEAAENAQETKAQLIGSLHNQSYQTALNAFQADQQRLLQAQAANQQAALTGRGRNLHAELANQQAQLAAQQMGTEQQLTAAQLLGSLGAQKQKQQIAAAQALYNFGLPLHRLQQNRLDFNFLNNYRHPQEHELANLNSLIGTVAGTPTGKTITTTKPTYSNPMGSTLGMAASGAALGTAILPGWGTAIGAAGGALLSLF